MSVGRWKAIKQLTLTLTNCPPRFHWVGVINLDIFTKAVIFAESFTLQYILYIYNISEMCVHIYLIRWNTVKIMYLLKLSSSLKYWTPAQSITLYKTLGRGELDLGLKTRMMNVFSLKRCGYLKERWKLEFTRNYKLNAPP